MHAPYLLIWPIFTVAATGHLLSSSPSSSVPHLLLQPLAPDPLQLSHCLFLRPRFLPWPHLFFFTLHPL